MTQNSIDLKVTNNADGFDVTGGATPRKLSVSGGDITAVGTGAANTITFPSATGTLALTSDLGSGASVGITVTQVGHGLSVGNVIKSTGANTYAKAQADSAANAEVVGYVTVVNGNDFTYVTEGIVTTGVPAVAAATVLFLSPTSAGALTATEPTAQGQVSLPLAVVLENATRMSFHKYRGEELGSSSAQATSLITTAAATTTLSLTTLANDVVTVWAKGWCSTSGNQTLTLKYNTVTKDSTQCAPDTAGNKVPFALEYTETPGAATHDITVEGAAGLNDVVIIAQIARPVQGGGGTTFSTTQVFSGTSPNTFTDLDLSSVVGASQRMVMLKVFCASETKLFVFRPNGDTDDYYGSVDVRGVNAVVTGDNGYVLAMVKTDTAGIVEWRTTGAETGCTISVESYW